MTIAEAARLLKVHPNTIKTYLLKHLLRGKVMKQLIKVPAHKRYHFVTVIEDESVMRLLNRKADTGCTCTYFKAKEHNLDFPNHAPTCPLYKLNQK